MRRAIAVLPALAVTLALFFLMQLLISGGGRDIPKPDPRGGVGLVTLMRDSPGGIGQPAQPSPLPAMPEMPSAPPAPSPATVARITAPSEPSLTTDIPAPETADASSKL